MQTGKIYLRLRENLFHLHGSAGLFLLFVLYFLPLLAHISEATETPLVKYQEHGECSRRVRALEDKSGQCNQLQS